MDDSTRLAQIKDGKKANVSKRSGEVVESYDRTHLKNTWMTEQGLYKQRKMAKKAKVALEQQKWGSYGEPLSSIF